MNKSLFFILSMLISISAVAQKSQGFTYDLIPQDDDVLTLRVIINDQNRTILKSSEIPSQFTDSGNNFRLIGQFAG